MRYRVIALTLSLACSLLGMRVIPLAAQDPQDASVADAARRTKEQKKSATKPAKVITNDSLPGAPAPRSVPTDQPAASPEAAAQPAANAETSAAGTDKAKTNPEVEALKQQIAEQQKQVDLLLRLYTLDQDTFQSNPDHSRDTQGKAKLDAQQEEIHAKVAEVARLKVKLDAIAPGEPAKVQPSKP